MNITETQEVNLHMAQIIDLEKSLMNSSTSELKNNESTNQLINDNNKDERKFFFNLNKTYLNTSSFHLSTIPPTQLFPTQ